LALPRAAHINSILKFLKFHPKQVSVVKAQLLGLKELNYAVDRVGRVVTIPLKLGYEPVLVVNLSSAFGNAALG